MEAVLPWWLIILPFYQVYVIENNITPDKKMEEKCKHCSARERAAMDAGVPETNTSRWNL